MKGLHRSGRRAAIVLAWLASVTSLGALSGCGTTHALQRAKPPGGHTALVYFIRDNFPPYIHVARLNVNGKPVATVVNNDFVAVNVPVGDDHVDVDITDGKNLSFSLPIRKAGTVYIVFTGEVTNVGVERTYGTDFIGVNHWSGWDHPVSETTARKIVAGFGRQLP